MKISAGAALHDDANFPISSKNFVRFDDIWVIHVP
jgi:hypothetical protein